MLSDDWCDACGGERPCDCDDNYRDVFEEDPHELVLNCGIKGCLMPSYHMRSECHTVEMLKAYEEEAPYANT